MQVFACIALLIVSGMGLATAWFLWENRNGGKFARVFIRQTVFISGITAICALRFIRWDDLSHPGQIWLAVVSAVAAGGVLDIGMAAAGHMRKRKEKEPWKA